MWHLLCHVMADATRNPGRLLIAQWQFALEWCITRPWRTTLALSLPFLLGALLTVIAIVGGQRRDAVLATYMNLALSVNLPDPSSVAQESPGSSMPVASESIVPVSLSTRDRIIMERLLQLNSSNTRARYLAALQSAARNEIGLARHLMRSIAPKGKHGYPPAHAWLAMDLLRNPAPDVVDRRESLLQDLEAASRSPQLSPMLLRMYGDLLVSRGDWEEGLRVLRRAAEDAPVHWLRVAAVAKQNSRERLFEEGCAAFDAWFTERVQAGTSTPAEHLARIESLILREDWDGAIEAAQGALTRWNDDKLLRRALSETLRLKFRAVSDWKNGSIAIGLLNMALKIDPTNPRVSEDIARLNGVFSELPDAMKEHLEQQLADGSATAVTHVILANDLLRAENYAKAIPHLEIALRTAPDSPIVLNNLALSLCRLPDRSPEDVARAVELARQALSIAGPNPELYDTLGEVLMAAGQPHDAIGALEAALEADNARTSTRLKLAAAYRAVGLEDMARLHEKLSEVATSNASLPESEQPPAPSEK